MSDYITGDEMISMLIAEGGSEAAGYALDDLSPEAVIARFRELIIDGAVYPHASHNTPVDVLILSHRDMPELIRMGYIYDRGVDSANRMYLTEFGAEFVNLVTGDVGCMCSARDHLIREAAA